MKAIMYGAGNIGRGFIGQLFYLSGYETTFIDVDTAVVDAMNREHKYPVFVTRNGAYVPEWVENVSAINGRDEAAVTSAIAETDIMATALGVNVLRFVAPLIAKAVSARAAAGRPLNILICENMIGSDQYLKSLVAPYVPAEARSFLDENVGFVSVSVGRTVPPTPEIYKRQYPLAVCAEPYDELPANAAGFRPVGCELPPVRGLIAFSPFAYAIERKLLVHNMGHALMAYLAYARGYATINEAAVDSEIKYILTRALLESARALAARHGMSLDDTLQYVEDLMLRFENPLLVDTVDRVGRDPKRKVSKGDRLIGAFNMVRESGQTPAFIAMGVAAAYLYDNPADPAAAEIAVFVKENGLAAALAKYSDMTDPADVALVQKCYDLVREKAPFAHVVSTLSALKKHS